MNPPKPLDLKIEAKPWFAVPSALTQIEFKAGRLKPVDAFVLAYFMDLYKFAYKKNDFVERKDKHWFYCTIDKMKADLNINPDQQRGVIDRLRTQRLIFYGVMESPTGGQDRRYFRINFKLIKTGLWIHQQQKISAKKEAAGIEAGRKRRVRFQR